MSRIIAMIVHYVYSCYAAATQEELLVVGRPTDTTDTTVLVLLLLIACYEWSHEQDTRFVTAAAPHLSDCDESNEEDDDEVTKMVKQDMMEGAS